MTEHDIVIVGSGINSLVCGALLAKRGRNVCIVEREPTLGGCIRTEYLTLPGFRHDTLSTLYPLFVTAAHYGILKGDLERFGVKLVNTETPTGVVLPSGKALVFHANRSKNLASIGNAGPGDARAYATAMQELEISSALTFGLLGGEAKSWRAASLLARYAWQHGTDELLQFIRGALLDCRSWLESNFQSELVRALIAPWVLHVGLGPDSATSAHMAKVILYTLESVGSPMIVGGSANLVTAFADLIREQGGALHVSSECVRIQVRGRSAHSVELADGRQLRAREAVICNVTPTQLYGRLLPADGVPAPLVQRARAFRYGLGEMQIHLALDEAPLWPARELSRVAMLHVTAGLNGVSRAVNEATRGLLPAEATIVVAQPTAIDPSRAPDGKHILWIQLQELPSKILGDALGEIPCPDNGVWTEHVRERYADRIVARLCQIIPNLRRTILGRRVLSPADLEAMNMNLVGGDPYSGACSVDQFLLWRPPAPSGAHRTPIKRLYHIGASTHPGPGLSGMSGYLVANAIH